MGEWVDVWTSSASALGSYLLHAFRIESQQRGVCVCVCVRGIRNQFIYRKPLASKTFSNFIRLATRFSLASLLTSGGHMLNFDAATIFIVQRMNVKVSLFCSKNKSNARPRTSHIYSIPISSTLNSNQSASPSTDNRIFTTNSQHFRVFRHTRNVKTPKNPNKWKNFSWQRPEWKRPLAVYFQSKAYDVAIWCKCKMKKESDPDAPIRQCI